ncbi:hypothetical protein MVEN_00263600 [Mycena venus]|uniref:Glycosyltransferase family 69 protein n=1 Tax=Mycena venus TaxID=2733690 RepID=A0A8H6Z4Y8_9AGAR|nr:hypothetical protein MVEN_00263600 [Mycena venus]
MRNHIQVLNAVSYRSPESLDRIRYAASRRPIPGLLFPLFQPLSRILLLIGRLFLRFKFFLLVSVIVIATIHSLCRQFWLPAFPVPRAIFVITLVAVSFWGMSVVVWTVLRLVLWSLWRVLWSRFRMQRHEYEPLAVDLDDLEPAHPTRKWHQRWNPREMITDELARNPRGVFLWTIYLSAALLGVYLASTYEQPIDHRFKSAVELANRVPKRGGYGTGEKVFIAAMFYNNGEVLPYWIHEVTKLIHYLGPDNVFVSILESHSGDNSAALLQDFDKTLETLSVARRILTHDTSFQRPPSMDTAPPRIKYLADIRNYALEPLVQHGGYTRVLFSNDIFIEAESIVELLDTKGGDYDMACGLDLGHWGLYDAWVIRDRLGNIASKLWPYFLEELGFRAVMTDEPAPVFTCWNGIVAFSADPFLSPTLRTGQLSTSPLSRPFPDTHPAYPPPANLTPRRDAARTLPRLSGPRMLLV